MNKSKMMKLYVVGTLLVGAALMSFTKATMSDGKFEVRTDKSNVKWKAYKTGGEHHGTVDIKSGSFQLEGILISSGEFVVDMTTIKVTDTESTKLHNHLHSKDFFNTKEFPEANLVISGSTKIDDHTIDVSGDMTILGKTNPVNFKAKIAAHTADVIIYEADMKIDRTKYGITYRSSLGDAFIQDEFDLTVKLVGVKAKS